MTVRSSICIGDTKHEFSSMAYGQRKDCAMRMKMQLLKSQGRRPKDGWLLENPDYAVYWENLFLL